MKFRRLLFFLLITNSIYGQSFWSYKERPVVPMSNSNSQISDSIFSSNLSISKSFSKISSALKASSIVSGCIDNIDFEFGNFTNWKCYKGTANTNGTNYVIWNPTTPVTPIANRHQLISAASLPLNDFYGGFPRLCPVGGNYSLQLGNNSTGGEAERVTCTFTIPADQNNFQLEYYYAVVFQDPSHLFDQQPRFKAKVYDANNSSNVISCASYDFTAASGLPGFQNSKIDPLVWFKPWTAVTINLSGYAGHTVILEFTTEDCTRGKHFGYAYIDVNSNCISLINSNVYCEHTPALTLKAPSGYETYNWYNSTFTKLLGTGQTITLSPPPTSSTTINVDLIPYSGFGCRDTAYTLLTVNPAPIVSFQSDTLTCLGKPISFINNSTILDNSSLTYLWNFGDNTTSTNANNTKIYNSTGTYKVKLIATSVNGCTDSITKNVSVGALAVINPIFGNKNICIGQSQILKSTTVGGVWKSIKPSIASISNTGVISAISVGTDTIRYIVSNFYGCIDSVSFALNVIANTSSTTNAAICPGDSYLFNGTSYSTVGMYTAHLLNAAGCDSTAILNLSIKLPTTSTTNAAICTGDTYVFNGTSYSAAGTYTAHLTNAVGCDSIVTLNLSIKLPSTSTTNAAICQGDTYSFNGAFYSTAGTYIAHLTNAAGCDSIATLNLSIKLSTTSTTNAAICSGDMYVFNGTSYSAAGTYTAHLTNAVGCDSIVTLNLSVKLPTTLTTNVAVCSGDAYIFNGASYNAAGTYTAHLLNAVGCDSIATLNLSIKLPSTSTTNAAICTGDTYVFNGTSYAVAGTYIAHLSNAENCDSIATLNLSIKLPTTSTTNAAICTGDTYVFNGTSYSVAGTFITHLINAAGCDSIATLNLSIKLPTTSTTNAAVCIGDTYVFNGTSYAVAGMYIAHLSNAAGCDSIATLNLSIKLPSTSTTNAAICPGDTYLFNGTSYSIAGTYTAHLLNSSGCDSTATLNLNIKLPSTSTTNAAICPGDSYLFNGINYNTAGTYTAHLLNAAGCDSTATLNLNIKLPTTSTTNAAICLGDTYVFNGASYSTSGTYTAHLLNAVGCDSIATLNLSINLPSSSTTNAAICQGGTYLFNGNTYSIAGTYTAHLINIAGCDSTTILNLSVKLPTTSTINAAICPGDTYSFNGVSYSTVGTYIAHLTNAVGCDSIATLNLSIKLPTTSTTNAAICTGDTYVFNGTSYTVSGTYTAHLLNAAGCDSIATLNLTVKLPSSSTTNAAICQGNTYLFNRTVYTAAGTYMSHLLNAVGCDSIATLNLVIKFPSTSNTRKTICSRDLPFVWNGLVFNAAGIQTAFLTNVAGCDSIAILELMVNKTSVSTSNITTCPYALPYVWNSVPYNAAGTYTVRLTNAKGCDSIATLILKVKSPLTSTTSDYICKSQLPYYWNKTLYYTSGTYTAQFTNPSGCDSVATLFLTVVSPSTSVTNDAVSSSELPYVWNKLDLTESGTYTSPIHYVNSAGCDSIAKLILKVNLSTSAVTDASTCASDLPYIWNGSPYYTQGTYTKTMTNIFGANVIVTLNLSVIASSNVSQTVHLFEGEEYAINGHVYDKEGTYTDILKTKNGCDSTVVSTLSFFKIPNTITPNGDGHNDVFMKGNHVQIYNRNGILLFEGNNGWDGKYHGNPVSQDTYFYVLYFISEGKTKSKEGYIMVIR